MRYGDGRWPTEPMTALFRQEVRSHASMADANAGAGLPRAQPPGTRVRIVRGLGEIAPKFVGQRQNPFDLRLLTSGGGLFPGLSGLISRRFGCYGVFGDPGELGAGGCLRAGGDLVPVFGSGHFGEGQGFQFGGEGAEPPGVGEPGRVGLVLGRGEQPGDGLAVDGAGPLDVGAVQGGRVSCAGAAGLSAPGVADGDAAGQAEADLAEGRLDRGPGRSALA